MVASKIGFIGLGTMGRPMATRLLEAGHTLIVYDTSPAAVQFLAAKGAVVAGSAAGVANEASVVFASLPTPDAVRRVAMGPEGVNSGSDIRIFIDLSTTGPRVSREAADALAKCGIELVDAPVSGGPNGAAAGTLAVMAAAAPQAIFMEVEDLLKVFGKVFHVGEAAGLAQIMKLINNLMSVAAIAITSEAMVMGVKAGLDPSLMIDVLNASSRRNSSTENKFPRTVLTGKFDFGFATGLSMKDIGLCLREAEAMRIPMPVGSAVQQMLAITSSIFGPDSDSTSICMTVEGWGGVEVRANKRS
jgi:3-hydroxyisobutyrate dehydrogenase-like beta-hydroxyacid dehydrogenase